MGFLRLCVKRYVAVFCFMIAITGLGLNSYRKLALEELPKTDMPYVTIITVYPGASPEEIETDVASPIEDAVGSLDGLKTLTSSCMENACQTLLEFEVGTDGDAAATEARERIDQIINDFPDGVKKPRVLKYDINAQPIINLAVTGDLPIEDLYDYADNELRDRLATVKGVADISLVGGSKREVQVLLDRQKLVSKGLTSLNIAQSLQKELKMVPMGRIRQQGIEYVLKFDADAKSLNDIESLEIANNQGSRCYIRDVGRVVMASEELRQKASINSKPCIAVKIIKKGDANAVDVTRRVKAEINELKQTLPGGTELVWVSDESAYIKSSVDCAIDAIWQGILLTAILMFFFLYNIRSTLTVAITMPVTVAAGIFFMYLAGYSLDMATLLSLALSIGILVTNSIVVLESITARLKADENSQNAAVTGAYDVFAAVMASAGTNVVVLFPIALMKGMIGQFFIPFALTMVGITIISLLISFTLTPALAGQFIKAQTSLGLLKKLESLWGKAFGAFTNACVAIISFIISKRIYCVLIICAAAAMLAHAITLASELGFTFLPLTDRGEVTVKLELPTSFSLENTSKRASEIENLIKDVPYLKHRLTTVGKIDGTIGQTSEGVHLAQIFCKFCDKMQRPNMGINKLRDILGERLKSVPDCLITLSVPDQAGTGVEIKMAVLGENTKTINKLCSNLENNLKQASWLRDIDTSVREGKSEFRITPKRAVLSDIKLPASYLGMALRTNIEGTKAADYKINARTYDVRVKLIEQEGLEQIGKLELPGIKGCPIVLENFVDISLKTAPNLITRRNKNRCAMFYANTANGEPLSRAATRLKQMVLNDKGFDSGCKIEFFGKVEMMNEGINDFIEVGASAFILTYLVLASILNSFLQPFIILITIPLGMIGCVYMLYVLGKPISMTVLLGAVMLIGIVVNNAILIMDKVAKLRQEGYTPSKAIIEAIKEEMRALSMITLAAIFGMLPLALDSNLGSELRSGVGQAAIGGLIFSAVFTIFLLPAFYVLGARKSDISPKCPSDSAK